MVAKSIWKLRSLILVFTAVWWSRNIILSSYTRLWNVVVLTDLNLPEDDNVMENGRFDFTQQSWWQIHPLVTAMVCTACENTDFENYEHKEMQASCTPSSFLSQEHNFLPYVSSLNTCFSGLHMSHARFIQALLLTGFGPTRTAF